VFLTPFRCRNHFRGPVSPRVRRLRPRHRLRRQLRRRRPRHPQPRPPLRRGHHL